MHGYSTINGLRFARCVKQDGFYTAFHMHQISRAFARCVKQDGSYTFVVFVLAILSFA